MNDEHLEKVNIKIVISIQKYIAVPIFSLFWRTSDFWTKLAQKNVNDECFEKINV